MTVSSLEAVKIHNSDKAITGRVLVGLKTVSDALPSSTPVWVSELSVAVQVFALIEEALKLKLPIFVFILNALGVETA